VCDLPETIRTLRLPENVVEPYNRPADNLGGRREASPLDGCVTRADNADMTAGMSRMSAALRATGIVLGTAGILAAVANAFATAGPHGVAPALGWTVLSVLPFFAVGVWLSGKRPDHPQARRLLVLGVALAVNVGIEGPIQNALRERGPGLWLMWPNVLAQYTGLISMIAAVSLLASYPDGVVERRWQRVLLRANWLHLLLPPLLLVAGPNLAIDRYVADPPPQIANPYALPWLEWLAPPLEFLAIGFYGGFVVIPILFVRFWQSDAQQRARMRLLVYVAAALLVIYPVQALLVENIEQPHPLWLRMFNVLIILFMLAIPATIVIGIVRHRLFDIDLAISRSLVFGLLTVAIAAVYIGLAAAPGLALGRQIPVELAVVLTIVAAVAFQPLRRRLEALADRWVFGERVNRYRLLTEFGASLEQTAELPELLPRLADAVQRGLAAPWVRVVLPQASVDAGQPSGEPGLRVAMERRGEVVGHIECGQKDGDYRPGDRELLDTLAGQAATAIANVGLTARLAEQVAELGRSRARIVAAQAAERQRIERNIHDGAQQQVVALIMKLRLARNQLARGDGSADEVLDELHADARELLTDLRELAHGIHPPVLSDRGLVAAVQARADRLPLDIAVHAEPELRERRLDTDVEGAAYFVVCEALTNVVKHSAADAAGIHLSTVDGKLVVLVHDNGVGIPDGQTNGHGLTNLRDRVEALGGSLLVDGTPGGGTSVHVELPAQAGHG